MTTMMRLPVLARKEQWDGPQGSSLYFGGTIREEARLLESDAHFGIGPGLRHHLPTKQSTWQLSKQMIHPINTQFELQNATKTILNEH